MLTGIATEAFMRSKVEYLIYKLFKNFNINTNESTLTTKEDIMRSDKQEQWYTDQKCVSIRKEIHSDLNRIRDEYVKRYHRNITLGYIIEMLLSNDSIITGIYNEIR